MATTAARSRCLRTTLIRLPGDITLSVIKLPSTGNKQGSILVNPPGGPGGSGVDFIKDAGNTHFTEKLRANYDVVGFDPRGGVGRSAPVTCMTDAERDAAREKVFRKNTDEGLAAALAFNKAFAEQCAQQTGDVLGHIDTVSAAKDLDILRAVANDAKLNYLASPTARSSDPPTLRSSRTTWAAWSLTAPWIQPTATRN